MDWMQIGHIEDIPRQGSRVVQTSSGEVALFRSVDDQVFALDNRCPHKGGPLSQGIVHGKRVTCPLHNWVIELETGVAVAPDAVAHIATRCASRMAWCSSRSKPEHAKRQHNDASRVQIIHLYPLPLAGGGLGRG